MALAADTYRWLVGSELPCLGCGYNLQGLVGPIVRCPECGHANDLRDPSPWRKQDLPLGVRLREHWPANAALMSLPTVAFGVPAVMTVVNSSRTLPLFVGGVVIASAAAWLTSCIRWVLSMRGRLFGIAVLVVVHACTWGFLLACGFGVAYGHRRHVVLTCASIAVSCAAGLLVLRRRLNAAEASRQFRTDWRAYRVPVGDAADQTFHGAGSP